MIGCRESLAIACLALLSAVLPPAERSEAAEPKREKDHVRLTVDYGDGFRKEFTAIPWNEGLTVLGALTIAQNHPRGIKFHYRGKGATAFLTRIDDLENEGRGRNWIYRVNNKLAERSFAMEKLKPADAILWEFGKYR